MAEAKLDQAYAYCQQLVQTHYENFPVASLLLPKRLRKPISVIYAFARTADDFADEGCEPQHVRLQQLDSFSHALTELATDNYQGDNPIFIALADVIQQFDLPIQLFEDLLSAFKQDVVKQRYANFDEVLDYCTRSANPVGRLLLHLNGTPNEKQLQQSDAVCTALQLINFYQDIVQDITEQDRIYIPTVELQLFGIDEQQLTASGSTNLAPLIRLQHNRARSFMAKGYELGLSIKGPIGWEVRAMTLGGIETLHLLHKQSDYNLLSRPRLSRLRLIKVMVFSMKKKWYRHIVSKRIQV
ncbi:MAG: squalene synthase HpnC [Gammaproteobacteria bacterium]|nr:squalene synthase HpnC [Gammaproteobacteria bacterium]